MVNEQTKRMALKAVLAAARKVVCDHEVLRHNCSSVNELGQTMDSHAEALDAVDWEDEETS